jgi:hypothetical protein
MLKGVRQLRGLGLIAVGSGGSSPGRRGRGLIGVGVFALVAAGLVVADPTASSAVAVSSSGRAVAVSSSGRAVAVSSSGRAVVRIALNHERARYASTGQAKVSATVVSAQRGHLAWEKGRPGQTGALSTPAFHPIGPRAVLRIMARHDNPLSPGFKDFGFGADVQMDAGPTTSKQAGSTDNGDNVVQRGLFGGVGQYKLQVDDRVPSCRVRGAAGTVLVRSDVRLVPRVWYHLSCKRSGRQVTLMMAKYPWGGKAPVWRRWVGSGPTGSVRAPAQVPLSVGGKLTDVGGLAEQVDQFNGRIDNVVLAIG